MRKYPIILSVAILCGTFLFSLSWEARAACRNPNVAKGDGSLLRPAAASGFVEIKWFGHAFFQITSSSETKIITDPFGNMGYPMPEVWPDVVTVEKSEITTMWDWLRVIRLCCTV